MGRALLFLGNLGFGLFALAVCVLFCTDPVLKTACAFFAGANLALCLLDLTGRLGQEDAA